MDTDSQELLAVYYEQQDRIFLENGYSSSNSIYPGQEDNSTRSEKLLEEWAVTGRSSFTESEPEDTLQTMINPNEVYSSSRRVVEVASETDSGISDDQRPDSPQHSDPGPESEAGPSTFYQVVYGVSMLEGMKTERAANSTSLVSIELGSWNTPMLIPETCVVDTAPTLTGSVKRSRSITDTDTDIVNSLMHFPDLALTEEEKRLLNQEGIVLPSNLPLTKAEERILKKVRRKIRNKQSAQESRRRKKEYIDGLESRVAACTAQNQELQKQVLQLEHHNVSLLTQLRRLQSLIKETSNKAAQTSTCIMIMTFSLMLLIMPSYNLIRLETPVKQQGYKPTGVISRTILTDLESTQISELAESSLSDVLGSVEVQEEAAPLADNLRPNSQDGPVIKGSRSGLLLKARVPPVSHLEDSDLQKTSKNSSSGRQEDSSDSGTPIPSPDLLRGHSPTPSSPHPGQPSETTKSGRADEM
ncbi:cyclic AMP-responsive element-binding protein 3-like protein 4 isoform X2 [Carcharodon carcharias]|uniref:cyclic AMP-responsive element-binding protein 3-like protein 4 isoform X2 n=1 Tax=Carcharodon carcharias TaxID=13397 RepID=UPI001B7EBFF2|nr:cyclic AMP-responsive element-binding protein 3-like protein 4 isoform X2 [Carcharodon carcharias]